MDCNGDVTTNWKVFCNAYEDYVMATQLSEKGDEVQAATLKTIMGKDCKQILNCLGLTAKELKKSSVILDKFQEHFAPPRNILYKRYRFHTVEQQPSETVEQFVICLKRLAETCEFTALHDEMIQDCLVLGSHDCSTRARLFHEKECDLKKAIEYLWISKVTQHQFKHIGDDEETHSVSAVKQQATKSLKAENTKGTQQKVQSRVIVVEIYMD